MGSWGGRQDGRLRCEAELGRWGWRLGLEVEVGVDVRRPKLEFEVGGLRLEARVGGLRWEAGVRD